MTIKASEVKLLREKTGLGMMECKNALVESKGDLELAITNLRKNSALKALRALFFLKLVIANSKSPFDSTRAFLHSIIPKPVFSLNNLTSLALIVITNLNKLTILKFCFRLCSLYFLLEYLKTQEDQYSVFFQHS